mmetsp:Transcript_45383/g.145599  ORF Transcript_45383/g.145599 Transcript_45383/m.145599 type:complete len:226 (+) Transcript_45383:958-1635(+)
MRRATRVRGVEPLLLECLPRLEDVGHWLTRLRLRIPHFLADSACAVGVGPLGRLGFKPGAPRCRSAAGLVAAPQTRGQGRSHAARFCERQRQRRKWRRKCYERQARGTWSRPKRCDSCLCGTMPATAQQQFGEQGDSCSTSSGDTDPSVGWHDQQEVGPRAAQAGAGRADAGRAGPRRAGPQRAGPRRAGNGRWWRRQWQGSRAGGHRVGRCARRVAGPSCTDQR